MDTSEPAIRKTIKQIKEKLLDYQEKGAEECAEKLVRLNQCKFRKELIQYWGGCSVTGFTDEKLLIASHIKPWRNATDKEQLNPFNGLLLIPQLDYLFDKGYISFSDSGKIILSDLDRN